MNRFIPDWTKLLPVAIIMLFPIPLLAATSEPPCVIAGCSGELCVDENAAGNIASICIWSGEFECYNYYGVCKKLADGQCGWENNYDLQQCLKHRGFDSGSGGGQLAPYREEEHIKEQRR